MNIKYNQAERTNKLLNLCLLLLAMTSLYVLSGCASLGPRRVPSDRFNYNEAVAQSTQEKMLLNIVRHRYLKMPVFLTVSSVLTQYVYEGRVDACGCGAGAYAAHGLTVKIPGGGEGQIFNF
jgi:uncharacterized protein YceK